MYICISKLIIIYEKKSDLLNVILEKQLKTKAFSTFLYILIIIEIL